MSAFAYQAAMILAALGTVWYVAWAYERADGRGSWDEYKARLGHHWPVAITLAVAMTTVLLWGLVFMPYAVGWVSIAHAIWGGAL